MEIPTIDFAKCAIDNDSVTEEDKKVIGDRVYEALATVGFMYLKNTGISDDQASAVWYKAKEFFNLDEEIKQKFLLDENFYGYIRNEGERLNPKRPGDLKEAFDATGPALASEDTIWPDEHVPEFSTMIKEFSYLCRQLSMRLLEVLAIGMDVKDRELFMKSHSRMNTHGNYSTLRPLHYRPLPHYAEVKPGQIRLGEHTDFGSITLVFQDDIGGLQVTKNDGTYMDATPIPETVVVNIGDCLQYWTQGRLKATKHRILIPTEKDKYLSERNSVAYFAKPNHEATLGEIEYGTAHRNYCLKPTEEKLKPMSAKAYFEKRYRDVYI